MHAGPESILLVEDNEDDVFFMKRAMKACGILQPVHVVNHGQDAIDYLAGTGAYADRTRHPLPSLVFLDLKLPQKSGLEVLEWIRSRPEFRCLWVLVLTSSREESDVDRAYRLGVNSFLVKPPNAAALNELMALIKRYWLDNPQMAFPRGKCTD